MSTHNFSIEYLAMSLIVRLDIRNIFPPSLNNPELFIPSSNNSSLVQRKPPNAFLLCRKNVQEEAKRKGNYNMRVISKVTSILWKNASYEEKNVYKGIVERIHEIRYKSTSTINKKKIIKKKRSPSHQPYTTLQFSTAAPQAAPSEKLSVTPSLLPPPIPILFPSPFDSAIDFYLENNLNNQPNNIDFNYYMDFNSQFIIPNNYYYTQNEQNQLL